MSVIEVNATWWPDAGTNTLLRGRVELHYSGASNSEYAVSWPKRSACALACRMSAITAAEKARRGRLDATRRPA